jgi:hypothetical protein
MALRYWRLVIFLSSVFPKIWEEGRECSQRIVGFRERRENKPAASPVPELEISFYACNSNTLLLLILTVKNVIHLKKLLSNTPRIVSVFELP